MTRAKPRPYPVGKRWRILAHGPGGKDVELRYKPSDRVTLDEVVVDEWLHLEQMDHRAYWLCLGKMHFWIALDRDGKAEIMITDDGDGLTSRAS